MHDCHPLTQTRCLLKSWHIQHHQAPLNRERGSMPGLLFHLLPPLYLFNPFITYILFPASLLVFISASRDHPLFNHPAPVSAIITEEGRCSAAETPDFNPSSTWLVLSANLLAVQQEINQSIEKDTQSPRERPKQCLLSTLQQDV